MHERLAFLLFAVIAQAFVLTGGAAPASAAASTSVAIDDGEARAALAILSDENAGRAATSDEWNRLFATAGYRRLKQREAEFKRAFSDDDFRKFLADPKQIAMTGQLQATLSAWRAKDLSEMEARAQAYLPDGSAMHATIYPLVKPRTNSFVYQLDTDPAIMLYLDPAMTADQFSNTVSHELLHVGDAENCPPADVAAGEKSFTPRQRTFNEWLSAFGEGWAVLAAAGGPNGDPHWEDSQRDRDRWNTQMGTFGSDFEDLQSFFKSIMTGKLEGDAVAAKGFTYFGDYQGPWYTVGYRMDVTIEHQFGRRTLVAALCDKRKYLQTYNDAARKQNESASAALPLWDADVADFLRPQQPQR